MWKTYILKSKDRDWYYVGSTNDIKRRFLEHNKGLVQSTKGYRPLVIVFTKCFSKESEARNYEHKLKDCRKEKEKIIKEINKVKNWEIV